MKIWKYHLKNKTAIIIGIVIVIIIAAYFIFNKPSAPAYETALAQKGNITQEVSVTGKVKPATSVDLAFESSGKIVWAGVGIGNHVFVGQTLARLYNSDLLAQLNQAEASLKTQEAKLEELKKGTRPEEIQIYEIKVTNASIALTETKKNLVNKIKDAYTKSDDSIRNKADQLFDNPRGSSPNFKYSLSDSALETELESRRVILEQILIDWNNDPVILNPENNLNLPASEARQNLDSIKTFLEKLAFAVNNLTINSSLTQTVIDGYKTDISTARTSIGTTIDSLATAEEEVRNTESALLLAQNELALKRAGSTAEQIAAQEAQVQYAQASVSNYKAMIAKTILTSPINGVVTKQDAKVGEIASTQTKIISIISDKKFEIEVNVAEADIAKVKIGNTANITLDAYGEDVVFKAKVVSIDPAETMIEGVATYKTKLEFDEDDRVKSGMTANIDILTGKKEGVIVVPQRAVIQKEGEKIVRVVDLNAQAGQEIKEVKVKTGLRGSDGNIEIISGINEGDTVVTLMK